jgi:hypothetical protein
MIKIIQIIPAEPLLFMHKGGRTQRVDFIALHEDGSVSPCVFRHDAKSIAPVHEVPTFAKLIHSLDYSE